MIYTQLAKIRTGLFHLNYSGVQIAAIPPIGILLASRHKAWCLCRRWRAPVTNPNLRIARGTRIVNGDANKEKTA